MKSTAFARRVPALVPKLVLPLILALVPAMTLLTPEEADGQVTPRQRAEQTLPPEVFSAVSGLATELAASGVPSGPLFNKALEGMAKRVPANRLLPAVPLARPVPPWASPQRFLSWLLAPMPFNAESRRRRSGPCPAIAHGLQ